MQPRALFGLVLFVGMVAASPAPAPFVRSPHFQGDDEVDRRTEEMRACLRRWADASAEGATSWQQAAARMQAYCDRADQAVIVAIQKSELGGERFAASLDGYRSGITDHAQALASARVRDGVARTDCGQGGRR